MTRRARVRYVTPMKFSLDQPGAINVIRAYGPGMLRIGPRTFERSVIVTAATPIESWRPQRIAELAAVDLEPVLALRPEVLLVGSGNKQGFPDRAILQALYAARIGFEIMDTGAACRTFNVLVAEGRDVAAALIVEPSP